MKTPRYMYITAAILGFTLTACTTASSLQHKEPPMRSLEELEQHLAFTCVHENKPLLPADTQQLYNYALYHDLHNMWNGNDGDEVWQNAAVYYRIAAANGDYKANIRLQYLLESGKVSAKKARDEVYYLNKQLEKQLPATAYYNLYGYLGSGYGVKTETGGELVYLRKAADLGSREAQYELAEIFESMEDDRTFELRKKLKIQLFNCASEQGLGEASTALGFIFKITEKYPESVKAFHQGVKNGSSPSANVLIYALQAGLDKNNNDYLGLKPDAERLRRYRQIEEFLYDYKFLQPKVPDLDQIVPLPPAKLPQWDGKIAFQRWFEGPSPQKPSDELMQKLATQAGLDWQTGLPLKK